MFSQARKWPYRKSADTMLHVCLKCGVDFWADSKFIRICKKCHDGADYQGGTDYTTIAWRGAG